eukprot:maker-scaffold396_size184579-snap-gene-0.23 protein:Tk06613 transcript:maker-scaffold396_size184579-snap-gene-0.23-mRNA-1 annotation:"malate dehydrogenase"
MASESAGSLSVREESSPSSSSSSLSGSRGGEAGGLHFQASPRPLERLISRVQGVLTPNATPEMESSEFTLFPKPNQYQLLPSSKFSPHEQQAHLSSVSRAKKAMLQRALRATYHSRYALARPYFNQGEDNQSVLEKELYVQKNEVVRFMIECMKARGCPQNHAERLALNLTEADYRGHFSHGLNRLAMYVTDIESGFCDPAITPKIEKESLSTALVDGQNGLGVVVGEFSMKLAIAKAQEAGVGWVCAKGSNHFGICQWYTELALSSGLMGVASTNTSPLVTPTRAKSRVFGTNPISVAVPGLNGDRFLLDMSTSSVAVGKIEIQMRKGEDLPSTSWALGTDGQPTLNAQEAFYHGSGLMPLGGSEVNSGYKGYGLAMMVDILCGLMSGSESAQKIRKWTEHDVAANLGQCFIAVDLDQFAPGIKERLQGMMDHLRHMEPVEEGKPVMVPGDPEREAMKFVDTVQKGAIKYTPDHITSYRKLAQELGVNPMASA